MEKVSIYVWSILTRLVFLKVHKERLMNKRVANLCRALASNCVPKTVYFYRVLGTISATPYEFI